MSSAQSARLLTTKVRVFNVKYTFVVPSTTRHPRLVSLCLRRCGAPHDVFSYQLPDIRSALPGLHTLR